MRHSPLLPALALFSLLVALPGCPGEASDSASARAVEGGAGTAGARSAAAGAQGGSPGASPGGGARGGQAGEGGFGAFIVGESSAGASGTAGSGNGDPKGGAAAGGAPGGGAGNSAGGSAPSPPLNLENPCVGRYQMGAPWPTGGRCSARGSASPSAGPAKFAALRQASVGAPVLTSPVIDKDGHVFIASAAGLRRFDANLSAKSMVQLSTEAIATSPIILESGEVVVLTEAGRLLGFSGTDPKREIIFEKKSAVLGTWRSAPAVNDDGRICFASPDGRLFIVDPTPSADKLAPDEFPLGTGVQVTTSAVTISALGDLFVGTTKGLAVLPKGTGKVLSIPSASVSNTAVFVAKRQAAIYADDGGVLHDVAIAGSPVGAKDTPSKVVLSTSPGSISVAQGNEVQLFIGDGKRLRAIAVTDAFTVLDPNIVPFVAAGPITAAAATDPSGRLYVPSADGNLYLVRRPLLAPGSDDNALESPDSFLTDGALTAPPALTPGRVYFGSADGNLYLLADEALP